MYKKQFARQARYIRALGPKLNLKLLHKILVLRQIWPVDEAALELQ